MRVSKWIMGLLVCLHLSAWAGNEFQVLCFHNIVPSAADIHEIDEVTSDHLINYFSWLKENGYHVVSTQDVINAKKGGKPLPEKTVLLAFDDGYQSFYTYAFPLLKAFNYPATLAIVGSWLDVPENGVVLYGDEKLPRSQFLSLRELSEVARSPLIEIASHTYDLHHGITGNAEGNQMPALTTLEFNQESKTYETEQHYKNRIFFDLKKNSEWIRTHLGKTPRVIVWPYGRYNSITQNAAKGLGMEIALTLDDGENMEDQAIDSVNRLYLVQDPPIGPFAELLRNNEVGIQRVMHVDLDYVYDPDPKQQEHNLDLLLERIKSSGVNTVYLQAFADEDGNGVAKSLYFPSRNLPMKADLFGRVSWQIKTRLGVRVYAWMPLLAFDPGPEKLQELDVVTATDGGKGIGYFRLSPFSLRSRQFIREIYEDLGKYAYFYGIVIHDDATLSDKEDASAVALHFYANQWGLPPNIDQIIADSDLQKQWTEDKTKELTQFALEMKVATETFRKPLRMARNYYAQTVLNPNSEDWYAQSIPNAIANFDWVAIMAMPYLEKASNPEEWLNELVAKIQDIPGANKKTVFELQARDWDGNRPIPNQEIIGWMRQLRIHGVQNFGYYPDDPYTNQPNIDLIRRELSTQTLIQP